MSGTTSRVQDYPNLRRSGAGVVDVDDQAYRAALSRVEQAKRIDRLEKSTKEMREELKDTSQKMDQVLSLLQGLVNGQS